MDRSTSYPQGQELDGRPVTVALGDLRDHCVAVLRATGLDLPDAQLVANNLVDAEARGIKSHGVTRMRIYAQRLHEGMVDAAARPVITDRSPERVLDNMG